MAKRKPKTEDGPGREPFPAETFEGPRNEFAADNNDRPAEDDPGRGEMGDGPVEPDQDGIDMSAGEVSAEGAYRVDRSTGAIKGRARNPRVGPRSVYLVLGLRQGTDSPDVLTIEKSYRRAHAWMEANMGLWARFYGALKIMRAREIV